MNTINRHVTIKEYDGDNYDYNNVDDGGYYRDYWRSILCVEG